MPDILASTENAATSVHNVPCILLHGCAASHRGGAANFGFISITCHQYFFGLYKYILRLEISIFDRENNKNRQELRIIICFRDIQ